MYTKPMRAILVFVIGLLFVVPEPAYAAGSTVYVQSAVGFQTTNLKKGAAFVDRYTGSRFVHGKCRNGHRCVIVKIDKTRAKGTGWASWARADKGRMRVVITVNPGRGSGYMSRLFAHEVAHAMFLPHSQYRTNLMWPTLHKANGDLVPWRFTGPQKRVLGNH